MAGYLHDMLARERSGRPHHRYHYLVQNLAITHKMTVMNRVGFCQAVGFPEVLPPGRKQVSTTSKAVCPETRTTASPASPRGVAIAAIVSSTMREQ